MPFFGIETEEDKKIKERAGQAIKKWEADTGRTYQPEQGAEEGDISDYVMPFKGIGKALAKGGMKAAVMAAAEKEGKKLGVSALKDKMPSSSTQKKNNDYLGKIEEAPTLDYGKINKIVKKPEAPEKLVYDKMGNPTKVKNQ